MNSRAEKAFAPLVGVPVGLFFVWCLMLYAQPVPIVAFERHADKQLVSGGDTVTITWSEDRSAVCSSRIMRQLISADGKIVNFEPTASEAKPIGSVTASFSFTIPPVATPGQLTYRAKSQFNCNWVQDLFGGPWFTLPDIKFEYIPAPAAG